MEGIYLALDKRRQGVSKKKNDKKTLRSVKEHNCQYTIITNNNYQLSKRMRIPYFRCIFIRTTLLTVGTHRNKSGITNLDNAEGSGIHCMLRIRKGEIVLYISTILAIFDCRRNCDI